MKKIFAVSRNFLLVGFALLSISSAAFVAPVAAQTGKREKLREVKIYLADDSGDADANFDSENPHGLVAVRRKVGAKSPLRGALLALTRGATKAEEKRMWFSATFGIKLLSVRLENQTAYTYFTMPEGASFSGDLSPLVFRSAVEKTALQFPEVKEVVVCLGGILDFWSESEAPPKKCPE